MFCQYCGKEIKSTDGFCEHCDAYVGKPETTTPTPTTSATTATPETKMCMACGRNIPKSSFYCPKCGKMANMPLSQQTSTNTTPASYGAGFLMGLGMGLMGIVIAHAIDRGETKLGAIHGCILLFLFILVLVTCGFLLNNCTA